jgi:hypothetical protein
MTPVDDYREISEVVAEFLKAWSRNLRIMDDPAEVKNWFLRAFVKGVVRGAIEHDAYVFALVKENAELKEQLNAVQERSPETEVRGASETRKNKSRRV